MEPRTRTILITVGIIILAVAVTIVPVVFLVGGSGSGNKTPLPTEPAAPEQALSVSSTPPPAMSATLYQPPPYAQAPQFNTTPLAPLSPLSLQPMTTTVFKTPPLVLSKVTGPTPLTPAKTPAATPAKTPAATPAKTPAATPAATPVTRTPVTKTPVTKTPVTKTPATTVTKTPATTVTKTPAGKFTITAGAKVTSFTPAQVVAFKGSCGGKCVVAGDAVAVTMQPGLPSPSSGGMKKRTAAPSGALEILSEFEVRFGEPGKPFDFVKGGKASVLGFQFGTGDSSGGEWSSTAASARLMFRRGGAASLYMYYGKSDTSEAGINNINDQQPEYAKIAKPTGTAGHSMWENTKSENPLPAFRPGQWHSVKMYGRMNTAAKFDGAVGMSVDGSTRVYTKMRWMDKPAPLTDLTAAVFFGGSDSSWNPPVASTIYFRNFKVTTTNKPGPAQGPAQGPAKTTKTTATTTATTATTNRKLISSASTKKWTGIQLNRFGDYAAYGQGGKSAMKTVACTGVPGNYDGLWTAMNTSKFGLTTLPCGTKLRVTAGAKSVDVVVADGGGSEGLDLDDRAYKALFSTGDGLRPGATVEQL